MRKDLFIKDGKPTLTVDTAWENKQISCTILQDKSYRGVEKVYFIMKQTDAVYEFDFYPEKANKFVITLPNGKSLNATEESVEELVGQLVS